MRIVPIYLAHLCNGGRRWRDYRKKDDEHNFRSIGRKCGKMAYFNKQQRDQCCNHSMCYRDNASYGVIVFLHLASVGFTWRSRRLRPILPV